MKLKCLVEILPVRRRFQKGGCIHENENSDPEFL